MEDSRTAVEEYGNADEQYLQLSAENREKVNLLVAETLRAQQSQRQ